MLSNSRETYLIACNIILHKSCVGIECFDCPLIYEIECSLPKIQKYINSYRLKIMLLGLLNE